MTKSELIARDMLVAGTLGAVVGQMREHDKSVYSAAYAGLGMSAAAIYGLAVRDPEEIPLRVQYERDYFYQQMIESQRSASPARAGGEWE
jgi:hypothetical protein